MNDEGRGYPIHQSEARSAAFAVNKQSRIYRAHPHPTLAIDNLCIQIPEFSSSLHCTKHMTMVSDVISMHFELIHPVNKD